MSWPTSSPAALAAGLLLLLFGRRLYWMLVGATGFVAGLTLAERLARGHPQLVLLAIALGAGLVGAVLALWLQEAMVALAGFAIGGWALVTALPAARADAVPWLPFLLGGVIGAVLVVVLFDWGLIVLSSLAGAALVTQPLVAGRTLVSVAFLAAAILGVLVQSAQLRWTRPVAGPP